MPELGASDLREKFSIHSQISDARLEFCLDAAIRDVKRKIGIEAYTEVFDTEETQTIEDSEYLDENVTTTDEEAMRVGEVTAAVLCYAMANVVVNCNLRIRPSGQVKREHDAASPGSTTEIVNEYLSPAEALAWKAELVAEGDRSIAAYIIEQEPANPLQWARSARS